MNKVEKEVTLLRLGKAFNELLVLEPFLKEDGPVTLALQEIKEAFMDIAGVPEDTSVMYVDGRPEMNEEGFCRDWSSDACENLLPLCVDSKTLGVLLKRLNEAAPTVEVTESRKLQVVRNLHFPFPAADTSDV